MLFSVAGSLAAAAVLLRPALGYLVPGAYIVHFVAGQDSTFLASAIQPYGKVAREMGPPDHHSASVAFDDAATALDVAKMVEELSKHPSIETISQINGYKMAVEKPSSTTVTNSSSRPSRSRLHEREQSGKLLPHVMTQVDKLHELGLTGNGIKVAVLDSGIDYTHPAFGGGCPGRYCIVENAYNYDLDDCASQSWNVTDCAGHGTEVAGIMAMRYDPPIGVGVSPGIKLAVYRTVDFRDDTVIDVLWRAVEDGVSILVMSFGSEGNPFGQETVARIVSEVSAKGLTCIVAHGNSGYEGVFYGSGSPDAPGVVAVGAFMSNEIPVANHAADGTFSITYETDTRKGGSVAEFSTWGPTMELEVKPQFGAPGGNIFCPTTSHKRVTDEASDKPEAYSFGAGTSYAAPYMAGIFALLGELNDGKVEKDLFERLLSETALPQMFHDGNSFDPERLAPVPQQGAGLVQAHKAASAAAAISPAALSFGDRESLHEPLTIDITRRCPMIGACDGDSIPEFVTFEVRNVPAFTVFTLARDSNHVQNFPPTVNYDEATLEFNQTSVTLGRGESTTIQVSATIPYPYDVGLPVWSGYITINGSDGSGFSVPYQGLDGSLRNATVLEPKGTYLVDANEIPYEETDELRITIPAQPNSALGNYFYPRLDANFTFATPKVHVYLTQNLNATAFNDSEMFEVAGSPLYWVPRQSEFRLSSWNGYLKNGERLIEGTWAFFTQALRVGGDASKESDYDADITMPFTIEYIEPR